MKNIAADYGVKVRPTFNGYEFSGAGPEAARFFKMLSAYPFGDKNGDSHPPQDEV